MFTPQEQRLRLEEDNEENGRSEPPKAHKARRRLSNQKSSKCQLYVAVAILSVGIGVSKFKLKNYFDIFNTGGSLNKFRRSIGTPRTIMAENLNGVSLRSPCQDIREKK